MVIVGMTMSRDGLGLADEVHVGIVPVLFGDGPPTFEDMGDEPVGWKRSRS